MKYHRSLFLAVALSCLPSLAIAQTANGRATTAAPAYTNGQAAPLSLDTAGNLRVNCVTGCSGGGTGSDVNIDAVGGNAVSNSVPVSGDVADGDADSGNPVKTGGSYTTVLPTYSNGDRTTMQFDSRGNLRVTRTATGTAATDAISNTTIPFLNDVTSMTAKTGPEPMSGFVYNGSTWDRMRGDTSGIWISQLPSIPAGSNLIGSVNARSGTVLNGSDGINNNSVITRPISDTGTSAGLGYGAANFYYNGSTWDRTRGDVNGTWVVPSASSSGTSNFSAILANSTNATSVKASAGIVTEISVYNLSDDIAWLKLYDASSAPTCGSGTPVGRYMIPGASSGGAGSNVSIGLGKSFSTGIAFCVTAGITDADTTAVAADTYTVNMTYK